MLKSLLKMQIMQTFSFVYMNKRKNTTRSVKSFIFLILVFVYIIGVFGNLFYSMSDIVCKPLVDVGLAWFYFALICMFAVGLSVIGSVFVTQSQIFNSKDNELLLSMPIPPYMIMMVRLLTIFFQNMFFVLLVVAPSYINYLNVTKDVDAKVVVSFILIVILISVLSLALTCILGSFVALISSRLRNKNIATIVFSLLFLGLYIWGYSKMQSGLENIIAHGKEYGENIKNSAYPVYKMGQACLGDFSAMGIFALMTIVLSAIIFTFISKSFISIATTNRGVSKKKYVEKEMKTKSVDGALLGKELARFLGTPVYLLNAGIGSIFMIGIAIFVLFKRSKILYYISVIYPGMDEIYPLLLIGMVCGMACMSNITASSISLEGKTIWNLQSLPVSTGKILLAKWKLHFFINIFPILFISASLFSVLYKEISIIIIVMSILVIIAYEVFSASFGLVVNLIFPNLNWVSEAYAVKQGASTFLGIFGQMGLVFVVGLLYYYISSMISVFCFISILFVVLCIVNIILFYWLKIKGTKIFENL